MVLSLDLSNDQGRQEFAGPGRCLCEIVDWDEYGSKSGSHILKLEILDHDKKSEIGKIHREYFSSKDSAVWRLRVLALATGLVSQEDVDRARESKEPLEVDFEQAIGRKVWCLLEEEEYEGKTQVRIGDGGGGIYKVGDPTVKKRFEGIGQTAARPAASEVGINPDELEF